MSQILAFRIVIGLDGCGCETINTESTSTSLAGTGACARGGRSARGHAVRSGPLSDLNHSTRSDRMSRTSALVGRRARSRRRVGILVAAALMVPGMGFAAAAEARPTDPGSTADPGT